MSEAATPINDYLAIDPGELGSLCAQYGILELAVFGSAARREDTDESDIDLLCTLAPKNEMGWAIEELNDRLAEALGRPVDLVSKKYLHKMLRDEILREAVVLYAA